MGEPEATIRSTLESLHSYPDHSVSDGYSEANPSPSRSAGSQRKRAPLTSVACQDCRRRKTKCDGNKPTCSNCAKRGGHRCVYDLEPNQSRIAAYKQKIQEQHTTIQSLEEEIRQLKAPRSAASPDSQPTMFRTDQILPNENARGVPMRFLLNPAPEPQQRSGGSGGSIHEAHRQPSSEPAPPSWTQSLRDELPDRQRNLEAENQTLRELVVTLNLIDDREIAQQMVKEININGPSGSLLARAHHLMALQSWRKSISGGVESASQRPTLPQGHTHSLP